jgi:hypothetical protein
MAADVVFKGLGGCPGQTELPGTKKRVARDKSVKRKNVSQLSCANPQKVTNLHLGRYRGFFGRVPRLVGRDRDGG